MSGAGSGNREQVDAHNFAEQNGNDGHGGTVPPFGVPWTDSHGDPRTGYYGRFPGDPNQLFMDTKMDWINDRAPGTTRFDGMWSNTSGFAARSGYPTITWLAKEIHDGEDVEFFVKDVVNPTEERAENDPATDPPDVEGNEFYHALTLTGVACADHNQTECSIQYQDPNDPTHEQNAGISIGAGGRLVFDNVPGSGFGDPVFIDGAFSESVPVPSLLLLLGSGMLGWIGIGRRRRAT